MKNLLFFLFGLSIPAVTFAAISLYAPAPIQYTAPQTAQTKPAAYPQQQGQFDAPVYNSRRDASASL